MERSRTTEARMIRAGSAPGVFLRRETEVHPKAASDRIRDGLQEGRAACQSRETGDAAGSTCALSLRNSAGVRPGAINGAGSMGWLSAVRTS